MAEAAVGLALGVAGLAGLFGAVVEAWDFVDAGRGYAEEYNYLRTRLDNQREIFVQWGRRMDFGTGAGYNPRLDEPRIRPRIEASLQHIHLLFSNTDNLVKRYGVRIDEKNANGIVQTTRSVQIWKPSFDRFRSTLQRSQKEASAFKVTRWSIRDSEKFRTMVECVSDLLRDLNEMTRDFVSQHRSEDIAREEAETIEDIQQLEEVQRATPQLAGYAETLLSSAASVRQRQLERNNAQTISTKFSEMSIATTEEESLAATSDEVSFHTAGTSPLTDRTSMTQQAQNQPWLFLSDQLEGREYLRSINLPDEGPNRDDDYFNPFNFIFSAIVVTNIPLPVSEPMLLQAMETAGLPVPLSFSYSGWALGAVEHVAFAHFSSYKDAARVILEMDHSILNPYRCELNVKYKELSDTREPFTPRIPEERTYATHRLSELIRVNLVALEASLQTDQLHGNEDVDSHRKKRMIREIQMCIKSKGSAGITESIQDCFVTWAPLMPENPFELLGSVRGPLNTPYEGGIFHIRIKAPIGYPMISPICWFVIKIYHPNIDEKGAICLNILGPHGTGWTPVYTITSTLLAILSLLGDPNFDDPVNLEAASLHNTDADAYLSKVKEWTRVYATGEIIGPGNQADGFVNTTG